MIIKTGDVKINKIEEPNLPFNEKKIKEDLDLIKQDIKKSDKDGNK